jgi:hypothetical protein
MNCCSMPVSRRLLETKQISSSFIPYLCCSELRCLAKHPFGPSSGIPPYWTAIAAARTRLFAMVTAQRVPMVSVGVSLVTQRACLGRTQCLGSPKEVLDHRRLKRTRIRTSANPHPCSSEGTSLVNAPVKPDHSSERFGEVSGTLRDSHVPRSTVYAPLCSEDRNAKSKLADSQRERSATREIGHCEPQQTSQCEAKPGRSLTISAARTSG